MAATTGHPQAQFNLGALLYNGAAGEPDLGEVYQWWTLAALQGHPSAQQNLEVIAGKLSREQLAAAQSAVAESIHQTRTAG
jgi:TPR repeat protein